MKEFLRIWEKGYLDLLEFIVRRSLRNGDNKNHDEKLKESKSESKPKYSESKIPKETKGRQATLS